MSTAIVTVPRTLADTLLSSSTATRRRVRDVGLVLGFAVLTAVLAQVRVNLSLTPVPVTGQTLGVMLAGAALGWRRGAASQLVYWLAGIVMPVAWYADDTTGTSIREGWNVATGTTAGYLAGFVVAAAAVGYLAERGQDRTFATSVPAMLLGTAVIYTLGAVWLAHELAIPIANGSPSAIEYGVTPFLVGDALKLLLAGAMTPLAWKLVGRRR